MIKKSLGFSFIELMVVLSVLAIIAGLVFPLIEITLLRQKEAALKQGLADIRHALDAYQQASTAGLMSTPTASGYPATLQHLVTHKAPSGGTFLRSVPADPFHTKQTTSAATWRLRAYNSTPDDPKPGTDIFDVYSSSDQLGSNGLPYSQW
jgi:general secretion pathway protein G